MTVSHTDIDNITRALHDLIKELDAVKSEVDQLKFEQDLYEQQIQTMAYDRVRSLPSAGVGFGWVVKKSEADNRAFKVLYERDMAERHPLHHDWVRIVPQDVSSNDYTPYMHVDKYLDAWLKDDDVAIP